jgi:hypothetical protein
MKNSMRKAFDSIRLHFPAYVAIVLVLVNTLIDTGTLTIAPHTLYVLNAILAALGLGVLHVRQLKN